MHLLDAPASLHELPGEPVEKILMESAAAVPAKVAGRPHQALAEMVLPDAVEP